MARTIEQILRDYLGDQVLMMARMTADMEKLRDELAEAKADKSVAPKANGKDYTDGAAART